VALLANIKEPEDMDADTADEIKPRETDEQAAARLMGSMFGMR
jgi:muconolactone delta-isomerase